MAKIYIDTNVFLDFYQAGTDRLGVFRDFATRATSVILPEQTIREFRRNRSLRLHDLASKASKDHGQTLFVTAIVREVSSFLKWTEARDEVRKRADEIAQQLLTWANDEASDPVLAEFEKLVATATSLPTTDIAIEKAKRRKVLGDPPSSPDKHTIGDELIWETLLEGCEGDLIVVSRDHTFHDHFGILKKEFEAKPGRSLRMVTRRLRDALDAIGEPSEPVRKAEEAIEARSSGDVPTTCPKCGNDEFLEYGYDGDEGDSAWWVECAKCHHLVDFI